MCVRQQKLLSAMQRLIIASFFLLFYNTSRILHYKFGQISTVGSFAFEHMESTAQWIFKLAKSIRLSFSFYSISLISVMPHKFVMFSCC
jgi:hypothetical protein